jgi:hypothetical protein
MLHCTQTRRGGARGRSDAADDARGTCGATKGADDGESSCGATRTSRKKKPSLLFSIRLFLHSSLFPPRAMVRVLASRRPSRVRRHPHADTIPLKQRLTPHTAPLPVAVPTPPRSPARAPARRRRRSPRPRLARHPRRRRARRSPRPRRRPHRRRRRRATRCTRRARRTSASATTCSTRRISRALSSGRGTCGCSDKRRCSTSALRCRPPSTSFQSRSTLQSPSPFFSFSCVRAARGARARGRFAGAHE